VSEPLFEATTMEIRDGPNFAVRALGRNTEMEGVQYLHVRDADGTELAKVERVEYVSAAGKLLGAIFSLILGGGGSKLSKQRVLGASGNELFTLEISGTSVIVKEPDDRPIAMLSNESRAGGKVVRLMFRGPPRGKRYGWRRPDTVLEIEEPQKGHEPFDWAVKTPRGATVARAANAGEGVNVVTVLGGLDEQQRRVLAAFACSLIERRWAEIPPAPTGGD
jgi:hypothetical protein